MGVFKRTSHSSDGGSPHAGEKDVGKAEYGDYPPGSAGVEEVQVVDHVSLHRGLKARHITMIAIGGAIGTGLIIGTGKALAQAG